jgi:twinkle protein
MEASVDCVSLPNGANLDGKLDAETLSDESKFKRYTNIAIVLDNDEPGQATARTLANWLAPLVDRIKVVMLEKHKDSSDYLKAGDTSQWLEELAKSKQFSPEGIIRGCDIEVSDILKSAPKGYTLPYRDLNEKLQGVRKGEILTVCAASGIGKSTLVNEIAYHLVTAHALSVCHIALESVFETTAATYVAMDTGVPVARFRSDPSCIPSADIESAMDRTVRRMLFFRHFGSIDTFQFRSKLAYYARLGVDFIVLDHLNMVISGTDMGDERKELDKMMTFLASLAVSTGVGIINVVHLKRREHRDGKGLNEGGQVSLTDLRGSAGLEQLSWAVIAMERNQQAEDGSEDFSNLRVLKNRTWGRTGKAGRLKYVHETGRLIEAPEIPNAEVHSVQETPEEVLSPEESSSEEFAEILACFDAPGPEEGVQEESGIQPQV